MISKKIKMLLSVVLLGTLLLMTNLVCASASELEEMVEVVDGEEGVVPEKPKAPEGFTGENLSSSEIITIMDEDGTIIDRTEEILKPSESAGISFFSLGPLLVDFYIKDLGVTTKYTDVFSGEEGYTHGAHGGDALYLGEVDGKIKFMMSGVVGLVEPQDVNLIAFDNAQSYSYYQVNDSGTLIHYITTDVNKSNPEWSRLNNGPAPSYLQKGVRYLSYDGHYFYTVDQYEVMQEDCNAGHRNHAVNASDPFYNYYQYLPFRSTTNYSESELTSILNNDSNVAGTNSKLINLGSTFVEKQNIYGVNALLAVGIACNESGWGQSNYAINRNNLFGINAPDANPDNAKVFTSTAECVDRFMEHYVSSYYSNPTNWRFNGSFLGNKASGMNVRWASDPYWGEKAAAIAWKLDTAGGNKDLHKYTIGIKDFISTKHTALNIRNGASTSSTVLYNTALTSHAFLILDSTPTNDFYKIQSEGVLNSERTDIDSSTGTYNADSMYLYASSKYVTIVHQGQNNNHGNTGGSSSSASVSYKAHVAEIGWQSTVSDGAVAGTTGMNLAMEAIQIGVNKEGLGVQYQTHVAEIGWMDPVSDNQVSGTTGRALAMEAIRINLTGAQKDAYDIYYRAHVTNFGWLDWAKNGESAGSAGYAYTLQALEIQVLPKGTTPEGYDPSGVPYQEKFRIFYDAHVSDLGWLGFGEVDDTLIGTTGLNLGMEAIQLETNGAKGIGIAYSAHVRDIGWMDEVSDGATAGTTGRALTMEAIKIRLTGENADMYDIYYRAHVTNMGWLGWAKNGEIAGSYGLAFSLQAINIAIVEKGGPAPGSTKCPYATELTVSSDAYVKTLGWLGKDSTRTIIGTTGKALPLQKLKLSVSGVSGIGIAYSIQGNDGTWTSYIRNGKEAGFSSDSEQIEAIKIKLTGDAAQYYDVWYRVHSSNLGWLDWARNGEAAGTATLDYAAEAIQIEIIPKWTLIPGATDKPFVDELEEEFLWPCPGNYYITSYFGYRKQPTAGASTYHQGIDIDGETGDTIVAAKSGVVTECSYNKTRGYYVEITHYDGTQTIYMHLNNYIVSEGMGVSRGQTIGYMGATGVVTGSHLHFSLLVDGSNVNPLDYVSR